MRWQVGKFISRTLRCPRGTKATSKLIIKHVKTTCKVCATHRSLCTHVICEPCVWTQPLKIRQSENLRLLTVYY